jgi:hypothetical protein
MHDKWMRYFAPSHTCKGAQNYYWSIFEFPSHYLHGDIYSYANFLMLSKTTPANQNQATAEP